MLRFKPALVVLAATVGFTLAGCNATQTTQTSASEAPATAMTQRLLFVSNHDGDSEIYAVDTDGGNLHQLTDNDREDYQASWSADGSRIAFLSFRDNNGEIYVMNADGSKQLRLTNHPGLDHDPQWAPDGKHIVFISNRDNDTAQLYIVNADGSGGLRQLTTGSGEASAPRWSPDGSMIALRVPNEKEPGNSDIALITVADGGYRKLTDHAGHNDLMFEWSPDSKQLAFVSRRNKEINIYAILVTTGLERQLTDTPWIDAHPDWSPDGRRITFLSTRDNQVRNQVFVMNADGSEQRNLTRTESEEMHPAWSADGSHIAFSSFRGGRYSNVYVMDAEGAAATALAPVDGYQSLPAFQPRNRP